MADPRVQSFLATLENSASAVVNAFAASVTAGNAIIIEVTTYNSSAMTVTVTDSLSNTYTQIATYLHNSYDPSQVVSLWYASNISGGSCTVTVTPSAASYTRVVASEFSGIDTASPLDSSNTGTNSSGSTNYTSPSVSVANAGSLVYAAVSVINPTFNSVVIAPPAVAIAWYGTSGIGPIALYCVADAATSFSFTQSNSAMTSATIIASFKPASGGGGGGGSTFMGRGILSGGRL